ncbi:Diguanylate cyclase, GGDEF domain [Paractinoplanes atraurantiacus]|uniref:Diguanylate cyclase, GGDEF domain n=2 Tax=Paractinoplanes atraurantiacus TaxID=1036182 RepID=A0A285JC78_9ACTN|nr:Diguanylate cyclase, GGDEF domain [Actinoplanes atraurantiacus]
MLPRRGPPGSGLKDPIGALAPALASTVVTDATKATEIAAGLCTLLATPVPLTAATVTVGASIGVALSEPGITVKGLTRRAGLAMYAAKILGKNRIETYSPATHAVAA